MIGGQGMALAPQYCLRGPCGRGYPQAMPPAQCCADGHGTECAPRTPSHSYVQEHTIEGTWNGGGVQGGGAGMRWKGRRGPPPPCSRAPSQRPVTVSLTPSATFNGI